MENMAILILSALFFLVFSVACFFVLIYEVRINAKRDIFFKKQMGELLNKITDLIKEIKK